MSRFHDILSTISDYLIDNKKSAFEYNVEELKYIAQKANSIIENINSAVVQKNLTSSELRDKMAMAREFVDKIHNFVMSSGKNDDTTNSGNKPGLWDNIRKKKQREGKNYRPAKRGDKDRPDPETWKKLTKK